MHEDNLKSTKIWRARTIQVSYTGGKPGMSFKIGQDHASVDWKRNCVT